MEGEAVEELGKEDAGRALVLPDEYFWWSAAWFLVTPCRRM